MRTPSGPRTNTANVLGASLTSSISTPSRSASAWTRWASSTSRARWLRQRASVVVGAALLEPQRPVRDRQQAVATLEAERGELRCGGVRVGDGQDNVVEIEVATGRIDQADAQAAGRVELEDAVGGALGLDRQRARDRIGITHPQGHPSQGADARAGLRRRRA